MPQKIRTPKGGYYQGMHSRTYWTQRNKEKLSESFKTTEEVSKYLEKVYEKSLIGFVGKYNDLVAPFVRDGVLDTDALKAAAKLDKKFNGKLRRIETEIAMFRDAMGKESIDKIQKSLETIYKDNYVSNFNEFKRKAPLETLNQKAIERAVKTPFTADGREFSDRIWDDLDLMGAKLRKELSASVAEGKSIDKTVSEFKKIFGNTTYNTRRLIRTETLACYAKAAKESYKDLGIKQMQVLSEGDACALCSDNEGELIDVESSTIGVDTPPFHPNCKCCLIPVVNW